MEGPGFEAKSLEHLLRRALAGLTSWAKFPVQHPTENNLDGNEGTSYSGFHICNTELTPVGAQPAY